MLRKKGRSVMLSMPEALPLPLGGGREGLAERNDRRSEASRNPGKEPSLYGLPILADSSLPLSMTPSFVSA
jgi:hypothetical protein